MPPVSSLGNLSKQNSVYLVATLSTSCHNSKQLTQYVKDIVGDYEGGSEDIPVLLRHATRATSSWQIIICRFNPGL